MFSADDIVEYSARWLIECDSAIEAIWVSADDRRSELCERVRVASDDLPVVPVVIRSAIFENPNTIAGDLVTVLESVRSTVSADKAQAIARSGRCLIVLLGRGQLRVPQTSSPVSLPDWFPVCAQMEVPITIRDVSCTLDSSLSSDHLRAGLLRKALSSVETALVDRLIDVQARDGNKAMRLWSYLEGVGPAKLPYREFLLGAKKASSDLTDPEGFRPNAMSGVTCVARLYRAWCKTSPDGLHGLTVALEDSLSIPAGYDGRAGVSIISVLMRPASPPYHELPNCTKIIRSGLVSIASAYQLSTAAAHGDTYPRFPVRLLSSISQDLRQSCLEFADFVCNLPDH